MKTELRDTRPIILLDLDNTILDFNTAERSALGRAFAELGLPFDAETAARYNRINIQHWEMLEDGLLTREEVLVKRFEALFGALGIEGDADRTQALYESMLAEGHWFMPGAEAMLEALSRDCRLFICSNGSQRVQDGRIASAGIAHYFERIFISEHMGCNKPDARYFELCFAAIPDFDRSRAILLGDSLSSDIRGGRNAGIRTCWYNPGKKPNSGPVFPDDEIETLAEFKPLLRRVFG